MRVPAKRNLRKASAYAAPKPTIDALLASEKQFNQAGTQFLKVDVATALTFANTALQADDPEKKRRNRASARKAYDTVVRMMKKLKLSASDAEEIQQGLQRLKSELVTLGEVF
jgi:type IV secretory pathway TrbF-like protein